MCESMSYVSKTETDSLEQLIRDYGAARDEEDPDLFAQLFTSAWLRLEHGAMNEPEGRRRPGVTIDHVEAIRLLEGLRRIARQTEKVREELRPEIAKIVKELLKPAAPK